jgi:hypothetical protein
MAGEHLTQSGFGLGRQSPKFVPTNLEEFFSKSRENKLETPVDELTGLPYPIAPSDSYLPAGEPEAFDKHHHFHPSDDIRLQTVGGEALRACRKQIVDVYDHNVGTGSYHHFFRGPRIPRRPVEQFKTCVYACAGYIPEKGIDMSSGEPKEVELGSRQIKWLRIVDPSSNFGYKNLRYDYYPVHKFFTKFALAQDFSELDKKAIEKFLLAPDGKIKQGLVRQLIYQASNLAVDPIKNDYYEAYSAGLLDTAIKADPGLVVARRIESRNTKLKITRLLEKKAMQALAA